MKTTPKVLSKGIIQFLLPPDDDGFDEQNHERDEHASPIVRNSAAVDTPEYKEKKQTFLDKFRKGDNAPTQAQIDQAKADAERQAAEKEAQKTEAQKVVAEGKEKKGPGDNLPTILEKKRAAEKERDEARAKVEEYEKKIKPELDSKIAELQAKIDSGDFTPAKEKQFQDKIDRLEAERKEREDALVTENKNLKDRVAFYDIQNTPEFHQQYIEPVLRCHDGLVKSLNGNKKAGALLQRALAAHAFALDATTEEHKQAAITERGEAYRAALNEIQDEVLAEDFKGFFRDYLRYADAHQKALADHQTTKAKITKEAQQRAEKAYADQLDTWGRAYNSMASAYKEDETFSAEELDLAKDLGLDPLAELRRNNHIASKVIVGQSSMEEALENVHRGRIHPMLKARIKIQAQKIADLEAVVEKLRGGGTGGGGGAGGGGAPKPAPAPNTPVNAEGEKLTRDKWHDKFRQK